MARSSNPPDTGTWWCSKTVYDNNRVYYARPDGGTPVPDSNCRLSWGDDETNVSQWVSPGLAVAQTTALPITQDYGWGIDEGLFTPIDARGRTYIRSNGFVTPADITIRFRARNSNSNVLATGNMVVNFRVRLQTYDPVANSYTVLGDGVTNGVTIANGGVTNWGGTSVTIQSQFTGLIDTDYLFDRGLVPFFALQLTPTSIPSPITGSNTATVEIAIGDAIDGQREPMRFNPNPTVFKIYSEEDGTGDGRGVGQGNLTVKKPAIAQESSQASHERVLTAYRQGVAGSSGLTAITKSTTKQVSGDGRATGISSTRTRKPIAADGTASGTVLKQMNKAKDATTKASGSSQRLLTAYRLGTTDSRATALGSRLLTLYREGDADARGWVDPRKVKVCIPITSMDDGNVPGPGDGLKSISGEVYDKDGVPQLGVPVLLFRQTDNLFVASTTSGVLGAYSFPRDSADTSVYFTIAYTEGSPQTHGVSDRGLVPA